MVLLELRFVTTNGCNIAYVLLIHFTPICPCSMIHVLIPSKMLLHVILHQVFEIFSSLSIREDIFH
jgi:hypothetical protein